MSGVNDLENFFFKEAIGELAPGLNEAWASIALTAEQAWNPVSKPPREADGDSRGRVIVQLEDGSMSLQGITDVADPPPHPVPPGQRRIRWARVRDVVLYPPEGE